MKYMCHIINRSKVSLKKSKDALETYLNCNGDEWLDSACYDAQQSIEFILKGILLEYGISFDKTHDIGYLLDKLGGTDVNFEKKDDLYRLSTTLTSWEESGRYGTGIRTSVQTVQRIHIIYNDILNSYLQIQQNNQNQNIYEEERG